MARRAPGSGRGRGRPRKHSLPSRTRAPPTTSTAPASTTPVSDGSSVSPSPHTQKFVIIPNSGYYNLEPQPSFPQYASPPPPPPSRGEAHNQPASALSPTPSQLG